MLLLVLSSHIHVFVIKKKAWNTCEYLNRKKPEIEFEEIFRKNISKQKKIMERLEENLNAKIMKENDFSHVIPSGDPPFSVIIENGNGF